MGVKDYVFTNGLGNLNLVKSNIWFIIARFAKIPGSNGPVIPRVKQQIEKRDPACRGLCTAKFFSMNRWMTMKIEWLAVLKKVIIAKARVFDDCEMQLYDLIIIRKIKTISPW